MRNVKRHCCLSKGNSWAVCAWNLKRSKDSVKNRYRKINTEVTHFETIAAIKLKKWSLFFRLGVVRKILVTLGSHLCHSKQNCHSEAKFEKIKKWLENPLKTAVEAAKWYDSEKRKKEKHDSKFNFDAHGNKIAR